MRNGKPYSAIAHLAENVTPFIAMTQALRARGFSAPAIFATDREAGLLVIEDLGDEAGRGDPPAPIEDATKRRPTCWLHCTASQLPTRCRSSPARIIACRSTTSMRYLIEAELLLDWYLPASRQRGV